jgi:hypothetical protein
MNGMRQYSDVTPPATTLKLSHSHVPPGRQTSCILICRDLVFKKKTSPRSKPWAGSELFLLSAYGEIKRKNTLDPGANVTGKLVTALEPGTLNHAAPFIRLTELLCRM